MTYLPKQQSMLNALASYSNLSEDFVATPTVGTKQVVLSDFASSVFEASLALKSFASAIVQRVSSAGAVEPVGVDSFTYNAGTFTLTLSQLRSNFAAGDTIAIVLLGPLRAYDPDEDVINVNMPAPRAGENWATDRMMVEQYFRPWTIVAAGTHQLLGVPGFLHRIIATGGPSGKIRVYDDLDASTDPILDFDGANWMDKEINTVLTVGMTVITDEDTKLTLIGR